MRYKIFLFVLLFLGCTQSKTKEIKSEDYAIIDSVINKNQQNLSVASGANKKGDSLVTGKIDQTVKKITGLESQVKQLKKENNELKNQTDIGNDVGKPFIIRTISDDQDY